MSTVLNHKRKELKETIGEYMDLGRNHLKALAKAIDTNPYFKESEIFCLIHDLSKRLIELEDADELSRNADNISEIKSALIKVKHTSESIEYICDQAGYYEVY
jgi:phosphoribosylanthranilate isomerase